MGVSRQAVSKWEKDLAVPTPDNISRLEQALELVGYEINMYQAIKRAPETANYNKGAYNTGMAYGVSNKGFDAKQ